MAVKVVARGEESKKRLVSKGVTPGVISSKSVTRDPSGKRTTRTGSGEVTKIEEPVTLSTGEKAVKTTVFQREKVESAPVGQKESVSPSSVDFEVLARQALGKDQFTPVGERPISGLEAAGISGANIGELETKLTILEGLEKVRERDERIVPLIDLESTVPSQETVVVSDVRGVREIGSVDRPRDLIIPEDKRSKNIVDRLSDVTVRLEERAEQGRTGGFDPAAFRLAALGTGFITGLLRPIVKPKEVFIDTPALIITDPAGAASSFGEQFQSRPVGTIGELAGAAKTPSFVRAVSRPVKNLFVSAGSRFVPPEQVFSPQVLEQGKQFPLARSSQDIIASFEATRPAGGGDIVAATASPAKLKGGEAGLGRKGAVGLEDTGIFVTPAGDVSPGFLRVSGEAGTIPEITLNPFRGIFEQPTVTTFRAKGIVRPPRDVLETPGFEAVKVFQEESLAGTGQLQVTKRAIVGQGETPRQRFVAPEDFTEGAFNIRRGDVRFEAGTSELESVVPFTQKFIPITETTVGKIKGFEAFTEFEGVKVPIREAELVVSKTGSRGVSGGAFSGERVIPAEVIAREVSPTPSSLSVRPVGVGSPTTVSISEFKLPTVEVPSFVPEVSSSQVSRFSSPPSVLPVPSGRSFFEPPSEVSSRVPVSSSFVTSSPGGGGSGSAPSQPDSASAISVPSSPGSFVPPSSPVSTPSSVPFSTPISAPPSRPIVPPTVFPSSTVSSSFSPGRSRARPRSFQAFAKVSGRFVPVGRPQETKELAFSIGRSFTSRTPSRTFGVKVKGEDEFESIRLPFGFRRRKVRGKSVDERFAVEESRFAIDTAGEFGGITAKGGRRKSVSRRFL